MDNWNNMPWKHIEPLKNAKENIATPTAQNHIRKNLVNSNGNLHAHDGCSQNNKPYSGCRPLRCQHTVTFEPCIQVQAPCGRVAQRDQAVVLHLALKKWIILDQVGGRIFKNVRSSLCLLDLISTQCCGKCMKMQHFKQQWPCSVNSKTQAAMPPFLSNGELFEPSCCRALALGRPRADHWET